MHRDLKPENIMLTEDLHLKVVSINKLTRLIQIDFGDANYIISEGEGNNPNTDSAEKSTSNDEEFNDE